MPRTPFLEKPFLQTVYFNAATIPTPGPRTVRVIPWSDSIALDTALAYLQIPSTATSTMSVKICPSEPFVYGGVSLQVGQSQDFILTNYLGCDSVVTVTVTALPASSGSLLEVVLPNALLSCDSGVVILHPVVSGHPTNLQYKWSTGQTTVSLAVQEAGPVWVEVSNICQTVRRNATVSWIAGSDSAWVYGPNIISPVAINSVNQIFRPFFAADVAILHYRFEVYDRWGNLLFASDQPEQGWEGPRRNGLRADDVFVWQLTAKLSFCGRIQTLRRSGEVTVWGK